MKKFVAWFAMAAIIFSIFPALCSEPTTDGWILCQPDSYVNIRSRPNKNSSTCGQLYIGDIVHMDGHEKNGYVHCVDMTTEATEGWVCKGFIVASEPVEDGYDHHVISDGRVAARRSVGGYRRCWLRNNDILTVYMVSNEWCLTNKGFVQTEFIDILCPLNVETPDPDMMTWEED